ncbi:MAG: hypothetical protein GC202_03405 [Alphaproteobacteria bacterium]|nr:hypothetical protein [Alphaproteobacteria bacterium]
MRPLDEATAAATARLQGAEPTDADLARMVALAGPPVAAIARIHLPFDSEPSNLQRGLVQGKRA